MTDQNQKDPALEDAKFDPRAFGGDVDGPGVVSAGPKDQADLPLHAPPPKTKKLSSTGSALLLGGVAVVVTGMVLGVALSSRVDVTAGAGDAGQGAGASTVEAPQLSAMAAAAPLPPGMTAAAQQPQGQAVDPTAPAAPGATTAPTPRQQYLEWLERHHFDRLRARHVAEEQAFIAQMAEEGAGGAPPAAGQPRPAAPVPVALAASGATSAAAYTGQPRPDRIPPDLLAALSQAQGQAQGRVPGQAQAQAQAQARGQTQGQGQGQAQAQAPGQGQAALEQQHAVGYLEQPVRDKRPGNEVAAGSIIPATMLTAINSDLPGAIVAQVRSDVFDTFDFRTLLIPAGSRLIGRYDSDIATGQNRLLVVWDELIFPNGRRIALEGMGATDGQGAAGMRDQVHTHFWRTWGNALLISAIGVAAQQSQPQNANQNNTPTGSQQATAAAANSLNETAQQVLRRNLNISPTLEIRPGYTFNVLVNRSISLPPYRN